MVINRIHHPVTDASKHLRQKNVLITAGPTWVALDSVRVISNTSTGLTGSLLAEKLVECGARVTLLLGPVTQCAIPKKVRVVRFAYFDQLRASLFRLLATRKFDVVIHAAAVSDYRPTQNFTRKVKSDKKLWKLNLTPTQKIIDLIKMKHRKTFLVGFKFEPDTSKLKLIASGQQLLRRTKADLVVANTVKSNQYEAYIISPAAIYGTIKTKDTLANRLIKEIGLNLWKN